MALGYSSYSVRGARRRPGYIPGGPPPGWAPLLSRLRSIGPWLRIPVSLLAVGHIALVFLFPAGGNALLDAPATGLRGYLTLFPVEDALGFPPLDAGSGFLLYRVYTEQGDHVDDVFPDLEVAPRLRYRRWAALMGRSWGEQPELHAQFAHYIVSGLPSPPVRLELYLARWETALAPPPFWRTGELPKAELRVHLLGIYDGLTQEWTAASGKAAGRLRPGALPQLRLGGGAEQ